MTLLYSSDLFLQHQTGNHPENAGRMRPVQQRLADTELDTRCSRRSWDAATVEQLAYVHTQEHIEFVRRFASGGGGRIETDTVVGPKSYDVATQAAGAVCDAARRIVEGVDRNAFCLLLRPPGHHALSDQAMGFCLFNNVAVGARAVMREMDVDRVLVVDFDVHHGNGTQAIFWEDGNVGFLSMHRSPFYPGTGEEEETGTGDGLGATRNLPISFGTARQTQLDWFDTELHEFATRIGPQLVILSAGFDAHRLDPIGSLGLETEDFAALTRSVLSVADEHCDGRLVSVLEGGYNPDALADSITAHLQELLSASEAS